MAHETNTSSCHSVSGLGLCLTVVLEPRSLSLIISTWHAHTVTPILLLLSELSLSLTLKHTHSRAHVYHDRISCHCDLWGKKYCFPAQKSKLHSGASARMRTFCAAAFESNYHNYQLIKRRQRNAALMVLISMSSLEYWDEIKGTHPDKGSPYGGSGARRVR